jgi:hypothetical protein
LQPYAKVKAMETPRRITHQKFLKSGAEPRFFDYRRNYRKLDLRKHPELYRVGRGEEGVLLVEPYKSEILPNWRFKTPAEAAVSAQRIFEQFESYKADEDFVGMDMARKFIQMGFTRARRYANHKSGRKYGDDFSVLPRDEDPVKAASAEIFFEMWRRVESDLVYADLKLMWKAAFG